MRRKVISIFILLATLGIIISMVACVPTPTPTPNGNNTQLVPIIPDLIDYGVAQYLEVPKAVYDTTVQTEQIGKLATKQEESREDYLNGETTWNNTHYYPFDKPHFDSQNVWIEDDATTVTKVFCYSTPEDIIERMAEAGLDEQKMVDLVAYITRSDEAYDEFTKGQLGKYPLILGEGSAIHDYDNLDEISDIRDNFDDYKTTDGDADPLTAYGQTEDFWEDLAKLKKRKIYGEIFLIFLEEADKFARFQTEYLTYQLQVISEVMIPAYKTEFSGGNLGSETIGENLIDSDQFKNYMREELFDFEMLSYLLAFGDLTVPIIEADGYWKAVDRAKVMTLYGYTYQYEKNNHEVFDDSVIVQNGKTEYEDYLYLGHQTYFRNNDTNTFGDSHAQAVRYTEYDRRNYREAYRYSATFYEKYYSAQYEFQKLQEARDMEVYTDSVEYQDGIGYATNSEITYTDEMIEGLAMGFAETLKLSDVNYDYTGDEGKVTRYNAKNTAWNSLTDAQKEQRGVNAIKEVELQIQQLTSQQYTIDHETITANDLIKSMQYQIKSYSADYIRAIQDNKKEQVLERRRLQRAYYYFQNPYIYTEVLATFQTYNPETYEEAVVSEKIENLGRTKAMLVNLNANYSGTDIASQITQAAGADWKGATGISYDIAQTLAVDYGAYETKRAKDGGTYYVDEYFEDNLIRRVYDCGGTDENDCGIEETDERYYGVHIYYDTNGDLAECEKIYDSNWALSRLLNAHEDVLRHMAGQTQISFMKFNASEFGDYYDATKGWNNVEYPSSELQKTAKRKIVNSKPHIEETVASGDEISTIVGTLLNPKNMPQYQILAGGAIVTFNGSGTKTIHTTTNCEYEFDAWCVDEDLMYAVDPTEKFRFDIKLYPRYIVTNVTAPGN